MMRRVVDTNVAIVANGREDNAHPLCRLAAAQGLRDILDHGVIIVDIAGAMLAEYRSYCEPRGQPGLGDRFFREVLMNYGGRIERVDLPLDPATGEYIDFPADPDLAGFDPSDRKFAAASRKGGALVANATDSDWLQHKAALARNGIEVEFLCGCDLRRWWLPHNA
jgi:hypothetical protein